MSRTKNGKKPIKIWQPLQRAELAIPEADRVLKAAGGQCWINVKYQVVVMPLTSDGLEGSLHLSIKRRDKQPLLDWRDLQRIKNELCGSEREALQLFPAESRLVDEANQFHLWVLPVGQVAPFGFTERIVGSPESAAKVNAIQREWEEEPEDLDTHSTLKMDMIPGWRGAVVEELAREG